MNRIKKYLPSKLVCAGVAATFVFTIIASLPAISYAAGGSVTVSSDQKSVAPGQEFTVTVKLDTGDATVNAVSGSISVEAGLSIRTLLDGDSVIPIWIERPALSSDGREISFAGIIPGGWDGTTGTLFSLIAAASSTGTVTLKPHDFEALAQGQTPQPIALALSSLSLKVIGQAVSSAVTIADAIPPDPFAVTIQSDPQVSSGALFAAFSASDKQSGIAGYEAAFTYIFKPGTADWQPAESPYLIPTGNSGKILWIAAIDHAGNRRIVRVVLPGYYRDAFILAILIAILLCLALFVLQRMRSRRSLPSL
jgi:hypothetical protein